MAELQKSAIERHIQSVLAAIMVLLAGWIALSVTETLQSVARLEEKAETLQNQLEKLEEAVSDIPSRSEFRAMRDAVADHESRLRRLENHRFSGEQ